MKDRPTLEGQRIRTWTLVAVLLCAQPVPAEPFIYAARGSGNPNPQISFAIDLATGATNPIPLGRERVWRTAVSPSGKLQLVRFTGRGFRGDSFEVSVIDTRTQRVVSSFMVREPAGGLAVAPHGPIAYATDCTDLPGDGLLDVVDLVSGGILERIPLDIDPSDVRLTPEGDRAFVLGDGYCSGGDDGRVAVVDTTVGRQITSVECPGRTVHIAVSPSGDRVFVGSSRYLGMLGAFEYWISVIDVRTSAVTARYQLPFSAVDFVASADGAGLHLLQSDYGGSNRLVLVDATDGSELNDLSFPEVNQLEALALNPTANLLYVLYRLSSGSAIAEVDLSTHTITRTLDAPGTAEGRLDFLGSCDTDCNFDAGVTVDEVVLSVSIALGQSSVVLCAAADSNSDGSITVDEIVLGLSRALDGCKAAPPTRTPTCTPTATATPLEPGGCSDVCDGRPCYGARCPNGDVGFGYCWGQRQGMCSCEPFECLGTCDVRVVPVISPWEGNSQILSGSASYYGPIGIYTDVTLTVTGGAEIVTVTSQNGTFEVDVPLTVGLNELVIYARNDQSYGPAGSCISTTRRDASGGLLDICACDAEPCVCLATVTATPTTTPSPTVTRTPCDGPCPTATATPTAPPTCNPALPERPTPTL